MSGDDRCGVKASDLREAWAGSDARSTKRAALSIINDLESEVWRLRDLLKGVAECPNCPECARAARSITDEAAP